MFVAAIASKSTQAMFIDDIATWVNQTPTSTAFTDLYDAVTGDYAVGDNGARITFIARPVVGGEFALLALNGAPTSGYVTPAAAT